MPDVTPPAMPPRRLWWRRAAWAFGGLVALWALAWLAVPPFVKSQVEQRASALLGREVRVGRVDFAPWSLALTLERLSIGAAAGASAGEPQFTVARVHLDADLRSLLRRAPVLEALEIDAPALRLARTGDGRYDIDDVIGRLRASDTPATPSSEPARFAIYNVVVRDGRVTFDDQPVRKVHRVQALTIALPFLSNLPADVKVNVEPRVAFEIDGARFDSGGQSRPFAADRAAQLDLRLSGFDLAPWLPYLPADLPLRPTRGTLAGDWQLQFALANDGTPRVALRGRASLSNAALAAAGTASAALASWQRLEVGLDDVRPLERVVSLGAVTLTGAWIDMRRAGDGRIAGLPTAAPAPATPTPARATAAAASASAVSEPTHARPWQVRVERIDIAAARVDWTDATTRPQAAWRVESLDVKAGPLRWPFEQTMPWRVAATLRDPAAKAEPARLSAEGQASDREAQATLAVEALDLALLRPYLNAALRVQIDGQANGRASLAWSRGPEPKLGLTGIEVSLQGLAARAPGARGQPMAGVATLTVNDAALDLPALRVALGRIKVDRPALSLQRSRDGRLNVADWLVAKADTEPAGASDGTGSPRWQLALDDLQLERGELRWRDELPPPAGSEVAADAEGAPTVRVVAAGVQARVQSLSWPRGPAARTQLRLTLAPADARGAAAASGRIAWSGSVAPEPLALRGTLTVDRLPAHALAAYADRDLPVALLHGDASWRGEVALAQKPAGLEVAVRGDARIDDLHLHERHASQRGDELLSWQSLTLPGLRYEQPAQGRPSLSVGEASLTDFYSRLVITEQGRFNLRDVTSAPGAPAASTTTPAPAAASAPAATASGLPLDLRVGGVRLANGRIDFTDRFIKPNYSAALSELNGRLGGFSSSTRDMATLELRGRAAGTALLEIAGSLNPGVQPLALDLRAKATDLELAPLSPYAGRYAGYAIERGKLSMDVAYKIDPDGKLEARNQVVLNQLTFGDKVESPDATKLPVLLAVALLKDRNGVIDINLPISGSINDPQFSVFGIVLKVIGNLLVKALTAPFALLAGGGSDDLSYVGFEPGTATFNAAGRGVIDKVAQALTDRPSLAMTVTGAADPVSEREAIQAAALEARLRAEQRRAALRADLPADSPLPPLAGAARDAVLKRVYADTRLPDKPRNVLGLAKDIPAAEMEALLKRAIVVSTESARELALQRGLAVRDALIAKGLPSERLFVAAPKLRASGEEDAAWSPRVQLSLSTR